MQIPFSVLVWPALVLGLVFGSFLNVCIVRLPQHGSLVSPGSHCPLCGSAIRVFDNVPLVSWLWLRGRCRHCSGRISAQYPLVETCTALLWIGCVLQTGASWKTLIDAVACFFLLGLAVMDAQTMLLPDTFTLSGIVIAFLLRVFAPGVRSRVQIAIHTVVAAAIAAGILLAIWALYWLVRRRHGIGLGDVKLMAMMAAFLGLPLTLFAYFWGIVAAAIFALVLLARGKAHRFDRIPLGSFLAAAGLAAIFVGTPVIAWYVALFR